MAEEQFSISVCQKDGAQYFGYGTQNVSSKFTLEQ